MLRPLPLLAGLLGLAATVAGQGSPVTGPVPSAVLEMAAAPAGPRLGGLVGGLISLTQPRDTTGAHPIPQTFRGELYRRTALASKVPWAGLAIGGALGWGLVNAFCDTENPNDNCGSEKLQTAAVLALVGGTVQLFLR